MMGELVAYHGHTSKYHNLPLAHDNSDFFIPGVTRATVEDTDNAKPNYEPVRIA